MRIYCIRRSLSGWSSSRVCRLALLNGLQDGPPTITSGAFTVLSSGKPSAVNALRNISVYDVHTDVLPVGLAGTGIVVNGILDAEPLVLEKRPVEDAST